MRSLCAGQSISTRIKSSMAERSSPAKAGGTGPNRSFRPEIESLHDDATVGLGQEEQVALGWPKAMLPRAAEPERAEGLPRPQPRVESCCPQCSHQTVQGRDPRELRGLAFEERLGHVPGHLKRRIVGLRCPRRQRPHDSIFRRELPGGLRFEHVGPVSAKDGGAGGTPRVDGGKAVTGFACPTHVIQIQQDGVLEDAELTARRAAQHGTSVARALSENGPGRAREGPTNK